MEFVLHLDKVRIQNKLKTKCEISLAGSAWLGDTLQSTKMVQIYK